MLSCAGASNRGAQQHRARDEVVLRGARIVKMAVAAAIAKAQPLRNLRCRVRRASVGFVAKANVPSSVLQRLALPALFRARVALAGDGMPARDLI